MTRFLLSILIVIFSMIVVLTSCRHQIPDQDSGGTGGGNTGGGGTGGGGGTSDCDPNIVYYQQVQDILTSNCTMSGCHDVGKSSTKWVVLTSYEKVMSTADVDPYDPGGSKLYRMITDDDEEDRMPLGRDPLTADQINLIKKWIQQGAKNLSCNSGSCDSTNVTYTATIRPIIINKCQGCHSGTTPAGGFDYSTYAGLKAKADDGRLWGAINHFTGFSAMPKGGAKLSDCEIAQFKKWLDSGAPNN